MSKNIALEILKSMQQDQSVPKFQSDNMTLFELMKTLQELFEKYPFLKDYPIVHQDFGNVTKSTTVEVWNKKIIIS